jgi:hypothetical protein
VGRIFLTHREQGESKPMRGGEGVGMVGAEDRPPAVEQLLAHSPAGRAVPASLHIADGIQDELPTVEGVVPERGDGEHVRSKPGVDGPGGRVLRGAGGGGGQQRHHPLGDCLLSVRVKAVADNRLHQPVDLEAVGVAAGQ